MKTVGICETQTITGEGVRAVLTNQPRLRCSWTAHNLFLVRQLLRHHPVDAVVLDKGFGFQALLHLIDASRELSIRPALVVWGSHVTESEALRLLREGVGGVLRKNCSAESFVRCLEGVLEGRTWVEDFGLPHESLQDLPVVHSGLTTRERQVLELVEQGMRNKEIATELGIRPGTVKIHMKHIFEKTGVHGRYGLAIQGLRLKASREYHEAPQALAGRAG